jgi:PDZ domain-containing protein
LRKLPLWKQAIIAVSVVLALYLFVSYPIPYYIERPGGALELNSVVEVDGEFSDEPGSYMMTTVAIGQATPLTYFMQFLPHHEGISERELLGDIEDHQQYMNIQRYFMDSSIHAALVVAFDAAGEDYSFDYHGVYVMNVLPDSEFSDELEIGDTVVEIDGNRFESSEEFVDYVANQEVGEEVQVVYERNGEEFEANGELIELPTGLPGIGISLVDNTSVVTDPVVNIHSGEIGGPSAGLMFALQVYSLLEENNLRNGQDIAGTGTISEDGTVGRIGGVDMKVVVADQEGASVFFVPDDEVSEEILAIDPNYQSNYEEALETAERIDTDMEIVPIKHFQDAIDYLESMNANETSYLWEQEQEYLLAS